MRYKKKYKIVVIVLIISFILLNIIGFYTGNIYYNKVCKIYIDRMQNSYEVFKNNFDYNRLSELQTEEVLIDSNFGYKLSGTYIKNPIYTQNTMVIVHGISGTRWNSMKYADIYINLGFNILIYDSRYHGKSGGSDVSLGFFEKYDLDNCIKWVKDKSPEGIIGVHGESLGAVTALLHSKMNENKKSVNFYVADCPYSDLSELFKYKFANGEKNSLEPVANFILFYGNLVALAKSGFSLYAVSPISAIKKVNTPIMFIHGSDDSFIPPYMTLDLYRAKSGVKYLYIAPNADHAMSYLTNKEEYSAKIKQFLKNIKLLD